MIGPRKLINLPESVLPGWAGRSGLSKDRLAVLERRTSSLCLGVGNRGQMLLKTRTFINTKERQRGARGHWVLLVVKVPEQVKKCSCSHACHDKVWTG